MAVSDSIRVAKTEVNGMKSMFMKTHKMSQIFWSIWFSWLIVKEHTIN